MGIFNGAAIAGATNSNFVLPSLQFTNGGLYSVVVSTDYGSVSNTAYEVVVNPAGVDIKLFPGVIITGSIGTTPIRSKAPPESGQNTNSWVNRGQRHADLNTTQVWVDLSEQRNQIEKYYRVPPRPVVSGNAADRAAHFRIAPRRKIR